jgi:hypothetical protein
MLSSSPVVRWTRPCHVYTPTSLQIVCFLSLCEDMYLFCDTLFMWISACVARDDEFSIPRWIGWLSCRVCNGLARTLTDEYRYRCGSRRICRGCPQAWPPPSPDLASHQFCLRAGIGCVKGMVYVGKRKHEMKSTADEGRCYRHCIIITGVRKAVRELWKGARLYITTGHFE